MYLPNVNRNAYKEYKNGHIENALFFDIDRICEKNSSTTYAAIS